MNLTIAEKIRVITRRKKMEMADLASKIGQSRQNLSNKQSRDNYTIKEAEAIAEALGAEFVYFFRFPDGTEI